MSPLVRSVAKRQIFHGAFELLAWKNAPAIENNRLSVRMLEILRGQFLELRPRGSNRQDIGLTRDFRRTRRKSYVAFERLASILHGFGIVSDHFCAGFEQMLGDGDALGFLDDAGVGFVGQSQNSHRSAFRKLLEDD